MEHPENAAMDRWEWAGGRCGFRRSKAADERTGAYQIITLAHLAVGKRRMAERPDRSGVIS